MDVKPVMCQDVRQLDAAEVRAEEIQRTSLLQEVNKVLFLKQRRVFFSILVFVCH